jgi:hypothetical protein
MRSPDAEDSSSLSDFGIVGCECTAAAHFFTVFLPHSSTMGRRCRQKLTSLGRILAFDAQSPTGS